MVIKQKLGILDGSQASGPQYSSTSLTFDRHALCSVTVRCGPWQTRGVMAGMGLSTGPGRHL
ncbi:hypothetical protein E2C01_088969 [Portunus trituberculatus]|uniref:Uncharacterized protein n=1 Tax=Portunus trituberculatus TaxID=210409 RepID=A0A5B7JNB1_PORTR|nr:hypothetical protein [Portunus trituberculatus]